MIVVRLAGSCSATRACLRLETNFPVFFFLMIMVLLDGSSVATMWRVWRR